MITADMVHELKATQQALAETFLDSQLPEQARAYYELAGDDLASALAFIKEARLAIREATTVASEVM